MCAREWMICISILAELLLSLLVDDKEAHGHPRGPTSSWRSNAGSRASPLARKKQQRRRSRRRRLLRFNRKRISPHRSRRPPSRQRCSNPHPRTTGAPLPPATLAIGTMRCGSAKCMGKTGRLTDPWPFLGAKAPHRSDRDKSTLLSGVADVFRAAFFLVSLGLLSLWTFQFLLALRESRREGPPLRAHHLSAGPFHGPRLLSLLLANSPSRRGAGHQKETRPRPLRQPGPLWLWMCLRMPPSPCRRRRRRRQHGSRTPTSSRSSPARRLHLRGLQGMWKGQ